MKRRKFLTVAGAGAIGAGLLPTAMMGSRTAAKPQAANPVPCYTVTPQDTDTEVFRHRAAFQHSSGRIEIIEWDGSRYSEVSIGGHPGDYRRVYHSVCVIDSIAVTSEESMFANWLNKG